MQVITTRAGRLSYEESLQVEFRRRRKDEAGKYKEEILGSKEGGKYSFS